jgi:hypothetical protein
VVFSIAAFVPRVIAASPLRTFSSIFYFAERSNYFDGPSPIAVSFADFRDWPSIAALYIPRSRNPTPFRSGFLSPFVVD